MPSLALIEPPEVLPEELEVLSVEVSLALLEFVEVELEVELEVKPSLVEPESSPTQPPLIKTPTETTWIEMLMDRISAYTSNIHASALRPAAPPSTMRRRCTTAIARQSLHSCDDTVRGVGAPAVHRICGTMRSA
ncbi:MAG TPA: hypothetical protein ENK31_10635 [Nannocystis exedens]|nr:hypothetical protein [Nannocystis exedens]